MKYVFAVFLFVFSFFFYSNNTLARELYSDSTPECNSLRDCSDKCALGEVIAPDFLAETLCNRPAPVNTCGSDWIFSFDAKCKGTPDKDPWTGEPTCNYDYAWKQIQCSATDTCTSGPFLKPGQCNVAAYNGVDPKSACTTSPTNYKACCKSQGVLGGNCTYLDPSLGTGNHNGICAGGDETVFCGWGGYPPCNQLACGSPPPPACAPFTSRGDCVGDGIRQIISEYNYSDGSGSCGEDKLNTVPDQSCKNDTPPPPPQKSITITLTPSPPPTLVCNQAYGTCGCKPGTGCLDGESTDYRCCFRTCDKANRACVTKPVVGNKPVKDQLNTNGKYNECNTNSECVASAVYQGVCQVDGDQAKFKVIGSPCNNCSYARYSDGSMAWQGESVSKKEASFTHLVDAGRTFTWYVNGKPFGTKSCDVKSGICVFDEDCDSAYQCEDP